MTEREKYLKHKAERDALARRLAEIPDERARLVEEAAPLAERLIRSEILDDGQTAALKSAVAKNTDETARLNAELENGKQRLKVLNNVLRELAEKAQSELTEPLMQRYRTALAEFVSLLRTAARAEHEVIAVREAARIAFDEVGGRSPLDAWPAVILRDGFSDALQPALESFIERVKASFMVEG